MKKLDIDRLLEIDDGPRPTPAFERRVMAAIAYGVPDTEVSPRPWRQVATGVAACGASAAAAAHLVPTLDAETAATIAALLGGAEGATAVGHGLLAAAASLMLFRLLADPAGSEPFSTVS